MEKQDKYVMLTRLDSLASRLASNELLLIEFTKQYESELRDIDITALKIATHKTREAGELLIALYEPLAAGGSNTRLTSSTTTKIRYEQRELLSTKVEVEDLKNVSRETIDITRREK